VSPYGRRAVVLHVRQLGLERWFASLRKYGPPEQQDSRPMYIADAIDVADRRFGNDAATRSG